MCSCERGDSKKPYRSTGRSWWLSVPTASDPSESSSAPIEAFQDELREAGPDSVQTFARFTLHPSPEDVETLDRRIVAILDECIGTGEQRLDQTRSRQHPRPPPAHAGAFAGRLNRWTVAAEHQQIRVDVTHRAVR